MADPTPDLSAVIAALTDATPETLREDAECAMRQAADVHRLWTFPTIDDAELHAARAKRVQSFQRLAALAFAIATMQERSEKGIRVSLGAGGCIVVDDESRILAHELALPAAIASLLSSEPAP